MKLWILLLGIIFLGSVNAVEMQDACNDRGFAYTQSSWVWDGSYINVQGSDVTVWGGARKAYWNSTSHIDGVVYKSGSRSYLLDGGLNGTVPKTVLSNDMEWITFCTNNEVPEFTWVGAVVVVGLVLFGYKKIYKQ